MENGFMPRARYTLAQAVARVNLLAELWAVHQRNCQQCVEMFMSIRFGDVEPGQNYCERGAKIQQNRALWKRRCKYAAQREGIKIIV
jgi:hypothetical protein